MVIQKHLDLSIMHLVALLAVVLISVAYGTELNSTHQYYARPTAVGVDGGTHHVGVGTNNFGVGSHNVGVSTHNLGVGALNSANKLSGKFRSSFYPSARINTTPSPAGADPVWVVWGRQGTPFDQQAYHSSDYQKYALASAPLADKGYKRNSPKYYDEYYAAVNNNPMSYEAVASAPASLTELFDPDYEEVEEEEDDVDYLTSSQIKGLMKTRRTGIESLGGILSLKGLKLSLIGSFYLLRGVLILAWRFLPWIFLLFLGLLFFPIPIITIPAAAGRTASDTIALNITDLTSSLSSFMQRLAESEQCVERIACEVRKRNRNAWFNPALKSLIYTYKSKLPEPFQRMAKAYLHGKKCRLYKCSFLGDGDKSA